MAITKERENGMILRECDRCKAHTSTVHTVRVQGGVPQSTSDLDLCADCVGDFSKFMQPSLYKFGDK